MINSIILTMAMIVSTILPYSPDLDALTGTQTITGTLAANLSITVSGTGNSNTGENGDTDCNTNFWTSTSFGRNAIADSPCTYLTFTAMSNAWEIEVNAETGHNCGIMYDDDGSDGFDNDGSDTLLMATGANTATNCDAVADQTNITASSTHSSLFLFAEGYDQSAQGGTGEDCNQIGVTTSAGTDTVEAVTSLGTPNDNATPSGGFGDGLVPDATSTDLLKCTSSVSGGAMFVDARVAVPTLAPEGTFVVKLTYTIQNTP